MSDIKKLFPIDVDNDGDKICQALIKFLCEKVALTVENKSIDIKAFHLAVDILRAFVNYDKTKSVNSFIEGLHLEEI